MHWTTTSFLIQVFAGLVGAHLAAAVVREHAFGFWGHTLAGLVAGAVGGYFLQTYAVTLVTGNGSMNDPSPPTYISSRPPPAQRSGLSP
jgi:uncharacterized membrane protein YeaQ/YmgE (transglycosylase-associated protein family)